MNLKLEFNTGLMSSSGCSFTNLNWIQYPAMVGHVRLAESVVSLGAALDSPIPSDSQQHHSSSPPMPAPAGSTALSLAVAMKAMYVKFDRMDPGFRRGMMPQVLELIERALQCCIILVMLDADVYVKFAFDPPSNSSDNMFSYHTLGINNLTVK